MQIRQIYDKYQIMPQLQTHMLRVAGIAKIITDDWEDVVMANKCVNLCLLHDMGNLAKFKLIDKDQSEWRAKQKSFWLKYGHDAHVATKKIIEEMGLFEYVQLIEEESNLFKTIIGMQDYRAVSLPAVLTLYADCRVAIGGVVSIEERIEDLERRYKKPRTDRVWAPKLEQYVQSLTKVEITQIKEEDVEPHFDSLLDSQI